MKVTFYSNFLTHHQVPFCLAMQKRLGEDFKFVSTMKIFQWRLDLGFEDLDKKYKFVVINPMLGIIIDLINAENYNGAYEQIIKTKEYRKSISDVEKEKMYAPNK